MTSSCSMRICAQVSLNNSPVAREPDSMISRMSFRVDAPTANPPEHLEDRLERQKIPRSSRRGVAQSAPRDCRLDSSDRRPRLAALRVLREFSPAFPRARAPDCQPSPILPAAALIAAPEEFIARLVPTTTVASSRGRNKPREDARTSGATCRRPETRRLDVNREAFRHSARRYSHPAHGFARCKPPNARYRPGLAALDDLRSRLT